MSKELKAFRLDKKTIFRIEKLAFETGRTQTDLVAEAIRLLYVLNFEDVIRPKQENSAVIHGEEEKRRLEHEKNSKAWRY